MIDHWKWDFDRADWRVTDEDEAYVQLQGETRGDDVPIGYFGISKGDLCRGIKDSNSRGSSTTL